MRMNKPINLLFLAALILSVYSCTQAPDDSKTIASALPAASTASIQISYKLDSRLTQSLYMGERWVSPPTYDIINPEGAPYSIEVKAQVVDINGKPVQSALEWMVADTTVAKVTPDSGNQVTITLQNAGETSLFVTSHGTSRRLALIATYQGNALRVRIIQSSDEEDEG